MPDRATEVTGVRGFKSLPLQNFSLHLGRKREEWKSLVMHEPWGSDGTRSLHPGGRAIET